MSSNEYLLLCLKYKEKAEYVKGKNNRLTLNTAGKHANKLKGKKKKKKCLKTS